MITANAALDMMRSHEWVKKFPWRHIEKLAKLAEEGHFEPGTVLFHQGDLAGRFYVIVSGTVGMTRPARTNYLIAQVVMRARRSGGTHLLAKE
jgi:CRP-like cAMP-binding protein